LLLLLHHHHKKHVIESISAGEKKAEDVHACCLLSFFSLQILFLKKVEKIDDCLMRIEKLAGVL